LEADYTFIFNAVVAGVAVLLGGVILLLLLKRKKNSVS
jgi:LPXTG-motif cell wall-anchored protein